MYTFMAIRIHQGKLTWDEVATFKPEAQEAIKKAYAKLYQNEEIPGEKKHDINNESLAEYIQAKIDENRKKLKTE